LFSEDGKASATWEIVSTDPEKLEDFSFGVALTALNGNPGLGIVKAIGTLGPGGQGTVPAFRLPDAKTTVGEPLIAVATSLELPRLSILSSASFESIPLAPDALVTAFSSSIKRTAVAGLGRAEDTLDGTAVEIIDSLGQKRRARALSVSPGQIDFLVPSDVRPGPGVLNVVIDDSVLASEAVLVDPIAPALFSAAANGLGYPVGEAIRLGPAGEPAPLAKFDSESASWAPSPVSLRPGDSVYLTLLATGVRHRSSLGSVSAIIGGKAVPAILASAHPELPGVDWVTVGPLPASLAGAGLTKLSLRADGKSSQELSIVVE
jgi:uncharacterized protein (TIGR03437 family)